MPQKISTEFTLLARRQLGCDVYTARAVMRLWAEFAREKIAQGRPIGLQGFGTFRLKKIKITNLGIITVARFKPNEKLKSAIKKHELSKSPAAQTAK